MKPSANSLLGCFLCIPFLLFATAELSAQETSGASVVSYYGYDDCIELSNGTARVVLCPAAGGRVLEYSLGGKNVLYLPKGDEGWVAEEGSKRGNMNAGRFDIGPEQVRNRGEVLWSGRWTGEVTGDRAARLTSAYDPVSGVRLIRDFSLDAETSRLRCTQTIVNESDRRVSLCHWSRTFAIGGGIAVVPRSDQGRFPEGYVMYEGGGILHRPDDQNVVVSDEAVWVTGPPKQPKLGFDSHAGWLAYLAPSDQLFVKRYETYPDRAYNEVAGLTASVWYPQKDRVELEPIGPAENLEPGNRASFTEDWWLLEHPFAANRSSLDFAKIKSKVKQSTEAPTHEIGQPDSAVVAEDNRVTFRFAARTAADVRVKVAGKTRRLDRLANGVWEHTTEPLDGGIHDYHFTVDGVRVTDPRNRVVKKWLVCGSMVEVPSADPLITAQRSVPHGILHRHLYLSKVTGDERAAMVYTPPGYDPSRVEPYPVLVLFHGFGDDETAWAEVGRAHMIVDNLIAEGKIEPMVVVMPNGHPVPLKQRTWSEDYAERNAEKMVDDVVTQLLPVMQEQYHLTDDAARCAVTGLSMGGGHAIAAGMKHPGRFAWVGAFSAAAPQGSLLKSNPELMANAQLGRETRQLFWIACGKDDFLFDRNVDFVAELNANDIDHTFVETEGAHSWDVWRDYLPRFLQLIYK